MEDPRISQKPEHPVISIPGETACATESVKGRFECVMCGKKFEKKLLGPKPEVCSHACSKLRLARLAADKAAAKNIMREIESINRNFEMLKNRKRALVHSLRIMGFRYGKKEAEDGPIPNDG